MALLSPGVEIIEKDFTTIVPTVSTSVGGIVGRFTKGPVNLPVLLSKEEDLFAAFGAPTDVNYTEWFTAAEFLKYSGALWAVRPSGSGIKNANSAGAASITITNQNEYDFATLTGAGTWIARDAGISGNDIQVFMVDGATWSSFKTWADANASSYPNKTSLASYVRTSPDTTYSVEKAAGTNRGDEIHILVVDTIGKISGTKNTVLEIYEGLSKCLDAKNDRGQAIYYPEVVNAKSDFIYFANLPTDITTVNGTTSVAWGSETSAVFTATYKFANLNAVSTGYLSQKLSGGVAGSDPADGDIQAAYSLLGNVDDYSVNLIMTGCYSVAVTKHVVESVVAPRKDCMAFVSPHNSGVPYTGSTSSIMSAVTAYKDTLGIADEYAQYAVMDTGFKYINDKYNNKFRWVPLNGDLAGLCAKVDSTNDTWWSPAGYNRGGVKNALRLSFNPNQAQRDVLYPKGINPVVSTSGSGTLLLGDRTMTSKPSAFDRINVRRLFNILEKSVAISAKYQLFEFNDSFTQAQFKGMIEPFLRGVQAGRGITDFLVVCDSTNNTGDIIDRNEFVADIYIKPARSINFIKLGFVATKTGVDFSTVIGG
jgi:hypothetical protein